MSYWLRRRRGFFNNSIYHGSREQDDCTRIQIQKSGDHGEGVFAKQTLELGTSICQAYDAMFVALDTPRLKDTCYTCYEVAPGDDLLGLHPFHSGRTGDRRLRPCEGCGIVKFCSEVCRKNAEALFHDDECDIFAALAPRVPPNQLRAVIRYLFLRKHGISPAVQKTLDDCVSHVDSFRATGGRVWEQFIILTQCAIEYSKTDLPFDKVIKLFCLLQVNAFPLYGADMRTIGLAMQPLMSKINHNCNPNSLLTYSFSEGHGPNGTVMTLMPLRKIHKDDEITVNYTDATLPMVVRRKELKSDFFFSCKCNICVEQTANPEQYQTLGVSKLKAAYEKALELFEASDQDTSIAARINRLRYAIHILRQVRWPTEMHPTPSILDKLVRSYIQQNQWNIAFIFAYIQAFKCKSKLCKNDCITTVQRNFRLAKILEKIIQSENWASQTLELADRELPLVQLMRYVAQKAEVSAANCPGLDNRYRVLQECSRIARGELGRPVLVDKEKRRMAKARVQVVVDEVVAEIEAWREA